MLQRTWIAFNILTLLKGKNKKKKKKRGNEKEKEKEKEEKRKEKKNPSFKRYSKTRGCVWGWSGVVRLTCLNHYDTNPMIPMGAEIWNASLIRKWRSSLHLHCMRWHVTELQELKGYTKVLPVLKINSSCGF